LGLAVNEVVREIAADDDDDDDDEAGGVVGGVDDVDDVVACGVETDLAPRNPPELPGWRGARLIANSLAPVCHVDMSAFNWSHDRCDTNIATTSL
jgi:hypothetical protein